MDISKFIPMASDAIPEELKPVLAGVLDGSIKSMVIIFEQQDETIGDMWCLDMNDGESNRFAVLGAIESLKRDFMDFEIESRGDGIDELIEDDDEDD